MVQQDEKSQLLGKYDVKYAGTTVYNRKNCHKFQEKQVVKYIRTKFNDGTTCQKRWENGM